MKIFSKLNCTIWIFVCVTDVFNISVSTRNHSQLADAVCEIVNKVFSKESSSANLISDHRFHNFFIDDFKSELLSECSNSINIAFRQESSQNLTSWIGRRRRVNIITISCYEDFLQIYKIMSRRYFWLNGFFLFVLTNGEIAEVQEIFSLLWEIQIFNANIIFAERNGTISVKTFMIFKDETCACTMPVLINHYANGYFANNLEQLFPEKMSNLQNCPIKVSISHETKPYILARKLVNGGYSLDGQDINLINTLAGALNFKINYTYIGIEGFFYENGTSEGPLKILLDGGSELSISDWWLKENRLTFFDATTPYNNDQIIFLVPSGREFTSLEKLIFPLNFYAWVLIMICFGIGFLIIFLIERRSTFEQNFVFGYRVRRPYLNMFIAFIGATQHILPRTNFARFLLMMFLMNSLVIRSLYQGSYFELLRSNKHYNKVESINEMFTEGFTFYVPHGIADVFQGTDAMRQRLNY